MILREPTNITYFQQNGESPDPFVVLQMQANLAYKFKAG